MSSPRWLVACFLSICLLVGQLGSLTHAYSHDAEALSQQSGGQQGKGEGARHACLQCLALCPFNGSIPAGAPPLFSAPATVALLAAAPRGIVPAQAVPSRSRSPPNPLV